MRAIGPMPDSLCAALALMLLFAWSSAALALGTGEQRAACTPDVFRLCGAQIPNVDAIVACLKRERANLSADCKAVFEAPERGSATRSLVPGGEDWCVFAASADAAQEIWRNWCGDAAR